MGTSNDLPPFLPPFLSLPLSSLPPTLFLTLVEDANAKREAVELGSGAGLSLPSVLTLLGLLMLALLLGQY